MSELRVVFLGTSSGKPTLQRNVSSVGLVLEGQLVLFDCGEGTQLQMIRAGLRPSRLALVAISHLHGDHLNGLPGFLSTLGMNQHERSVRVLGPRGLRDYVRSLRRLGILVPRFPLSTCEIEALGEVHQAPQFRVLAAPLDHRIETWGFRFEEHDRPGRFDVEGAEALGVPRGPLFGQLQRGQSVTLADGRVIQSDQVMGPPRPGRTVAYVPDTLPCDGAAWLADGVDLLIHEGTYSHTLLADAQERGHSTVRQAAEMARRAGAKRLIITHISPKHDDPRPLLAEAREVFEPTIIAKDLLSVEVPVKERP
jgi:ribonuclease Z